MTSAADIAFENLCSKLKESATNIARHSKCLAGLVNDTGPTEEIEKAVIQSARAAAKETAVLVDLINSAPVTTSEAKRLQLNILKNCGRDCSNSVLALIGLYQTKAGCQPYFWLLSPGASKKAISNPLDFLTKQEVINKCKEVAAAIKGVIEATEALKELCRVKLSAHIKEEGEKNGFTQFKQRTQQLRKQTKNYFVKQSKLRRRQSIPWHGR